MNKPMSMEIALDDRGMGTIVLAGQPMQHLIQRIEITGNAGEMTQATLYLIPLPIRFAAPARIDQHPAPQLGCQACETLLPDKARYCPQCGWKVLE